MWAALLAYVALRGIQSLVGLRITMDVEKMGMDGWVSFIIWVFTRRGADIEDFNTKHNDFDTAELSNVVPIVSALTEK